ncbi:ribosome maturation factor RimM [Actinomycetota bacterium]|nr:ribosome maturation factor RimM [Actinomycetota bacterium]
MHHLRVGKILAPVGLKGEVKVFFTTDEPSIRFSAGSKLTTDTNEFPELTVKNFREVGPKAFLQFEEVKDRNSSEKLNQVELFVDVETDLHKENLDGEDDGYYYADLVGLDVIHNDNVIGKVVAIIENPSQELLEVKLSNGSKTLIPFVEAIVPNVNLQDGSLTITPPDGLLDETY